jgi:AhpD family alkylhydroperoxidase
MTAIDFEVHTADTAPEPAGDALRRLEASVGRVPNLAATMAESPVLIEALLALRGLFGQTTFTWAEVELLSLVAARENDCAWCVAFHSAGGLSNGLDQSAVDALRDGSNPADPRLAALATFARTMVQRRGNVGQESLAAFVGAGFTPRQALDVVMGMAFSVLPNYAAHLTRPRLDDFLAPHAWTR